MCRLTIQVNARSSDIETPASAGFTGHAYSALVGVPQCLDRPLTVTGVGNFVRHANLEQLLAESSDTYML